MTNPYPRNPSPGSYSSSYTGNTPSMARRSSYASVVSGTANAYTPSEQEPLRSGFFSRTSNQQSPETAPSNLSRSLHNSYGQSDMPHSYNSGMQAPESWERAQGQHYATPFGQYGDGIGFFNAEPRHITFDGFFIPSYLKGSKHSERLIDKYLAKLVTGRDVRPGRRSSNGGSLSTSGSSMNLPKMVPSHRGMTYEIQERNFLPNNNNDVVAALPSKWNTADKCPGLEVLGDGFELKFSGTSKTGDDAAAIRTDYPIPKQCGIYYFEVTVISNRKGDCPIAIGFAGPKVLLNTPPGWDTDSWAYHGDDGYSFCQIRNGKTYGPKFGNSDIIGCGINCSTGHVFYTRNGSHQGTAFREVKSDIIFPIIGMKKAGDHVKVNLGQSPFVYDIDALVEGEKHALINQINNEDTASLHTEQDEATLLQELVAQYLAHDGFTETAKAFGKEVQTASSLLRQDDTSARALEYQEDIDAINRQRIRAAILDGDIDKALKHTKAFFPSVLPENENTYFKLRCRKFIEMVRTWSLLQPRSKRSSDTIATSNILRLKGIGHNALFDGRMELDAPAVQEDSSMEEAINAQNGASDIAAQQNELMTQILLYGQELQAEFKDDIRIETKKELEAVFALIAYTDARDSSLAPLLEIENRTPVADELSAAILVSLGKLSNAALERLVQQAEVLVDDLSQTGSSAALINVRTDFMR